MQEITHFEGTLLTCVHHGMVSYSSATDILHPMLFATQGLKKQLKFSPPSLPLLGLCPDDKLHADFFALDCRRCEKLMVSVTIFLGENFFAAVQFPFLFIRQMH